jgi:hypothetical protein
MLISVAEREQIRTLDQASLEREERRIEQERRRLFARLELVKKEIRRRRETTDLRQLTLPWNE